MNASAHDETKTQALAGGQLLAGDGPEIAMSSESMQQRWYVVNTQPRRELRAVEHLTRQEFVTFCPCVRRVVTHARKRTTALSPLFPNYVFVRLDLSRDHWRKVNGTRGVVRLLASGDAPLPVPRGVVEELELKTTVDGEMDWTSSFRSGDRVRISTGPFANLVGVLEHLDAAGRVKVLLDLLGRSVCVALRGDALQPAA
jgi:transcriptional antiterminator RfaH